MAFWLIVPISQCDAGLVWENVRVEKTVDALEKKTTCVYRFKNTGDGVTTITDIKPSCGCTAVELEKRAYGPGESGEIHAVMNFLGRVGLQEKHIDIVTANPADQNPPLVLSITIKEPLIYSTNLVTWSGGDTTDKTITVSPVQPHRLVKLEARPAVPAEVNVRVEPAAAGSYQLRIRPAAAASPVNAAVPCVATFSDGATHDFTVFAVTR